MSAQEANLLRELGISIVTAAKALGVTRQAVARGLGDENRPYLTAGKLLLLSTYLAKANPPLDEVFRAASLKQFGDAARLAFQTRPPSTLRADSVIAEHLMPARELWFFASQPRELERDGHLNLMRDTYFDLAKNPTLKTTRVVYFTSPQVSLALALQFLREFEDHIETPNTIVVLESSALGICPRFVLTDPLPETGEGWAIGESDDQFFKLAQQNVRHIVESVRSAGIVAFKPIMNEDLSVSEKGYPSAPRFRLAFDSSNLALSRRLLGLGTVSEVTPLVQHRRDS
jgi:hypothetical protein